MIRIAVFGSFYRGFYVLDELLRGPLAAGFRVVGVATDDVGSGRVSAHKRVWQYPHAAAEETMVEKLAQSCAIPVYNGLIKTETFYSAYERDWRPDICVSCTFGQRIDSRLHSYPKFGFFNLHPCMEGAWPSPYAGPNPFQAMIEDGREHARIALHRVDDGFDTGELIAFSERIAIPPGSNPVDMHKISSPVCAKFAVPWLRRLSERTTNVAA